MKRPTNTQWKVVALLALALATAALAGCVSGEREEDGMELPEVWGYVAGEKFAQLDVADQEADDDTLIVKRVLVPADAWIVVHVDDDGMPGDRVGLKSIPSGVSRNVEIPLKDATEKVIVAVHADRGTPDKFDFDMMNKMQSPDRPFFVNDKELAKAIELEGLDVTSKDAEESMDATAGPSSTTTPTLDASSAAVASRDTAQDDEASDDSSMKKESKEDSTMKDESKDDASKDDTSKDDSTMDDKSADKSSKDDDSADVASAKNDADDDSSMESDSSEESAMDEESSGEGEESEAEGPPAWGLLGGFLALNAVIIAIAAIVRRRSAKAKLEGSSVNA